MIFRLSGLILAALLTLGACQPARAELAALSLRCEYKSDPIGLGVSHPRLSWKLSGPGRGQMQTAYQIIASRSKDSLNPERSDVWNSGKIDSSRSIQVPYGGTPLFSREKIFWKVRAWDNGGHAGRWSKPASWEMGLLTHSDWQASWITSPRIPTTTDTLSDVKWIWFPEGSPRQDAPAATRYFRTTFDAPGSITNAHLHVAVDNSYEASINGREVGSGGGFSSFQDIDVTNQVHPGKNVISIAAVNDGGPAGLAAYLVVTSSDGSKHRISTDSHWKTNQTPSNGWMKPDFDDSAWQPSLEVANLGDSPWTMSKSSSVSAPVPYLRKTFSATKTINRARLYASARGLYKVSINGNKISSDIFTPGWTDYRKRIQYQVYDVTKNLVHGENSIGMVLGDGWYCGYVGLAGRQNYGPYALGLVQLEISYSDGTKQTIVSDESWKSSQGPIRSADLLMGEDFDARQELAGWSSPGYDDSKWTGTHSEPLGDVPLVAPPGPQVRHMDTLIPKTIKNNPKTSYVFDLGQNMVGWARLKVKGKAGDRIRLRFAEMLNPDGSIYTANLRGAKATDYYTCKGDPEEIYEPTFTFHGFRYVELMGYPGVPEKDAITGIVIHSDTPTTGTFACSSPLVNQLQHNIVWGQAGNYLESPTDCPQRDERLGWMGDAQIFIRTACYNMDVAGFMNKWVQDVVDAQSPEGGFSDVSPRVGDNSDGAPAWGDAGVIVPYTVYKSYDDTSLIAQHYDAMAKWIEYIRSVNPNMLWINHSNNNFGDWLNIDADMPRDVLGTSYFAYSTRLLSKMAAALGKTEDAKKYEDMFQDIKTAYNKAYVSDRGMIKGDTQTCYILALWFDLLPPEKRGIAADRLVNDIVVKRKNHLSTGFVGVGYLCPTLTMIGRADVAYKLLNNDTFPSWGYSIRQGATTIWERWDGWTKEKGFQDPGMNSFNHYSLGSVGEWLYRTVAGIDTDPDQPGYKHIVMHPIPGGGLTFAKANYDSIHGKISSDWKLEDGAFKWKISVPANTTATIYVPSRISSEITESGSPIAESYGMKFLRRESDAAVYEVGSGDYSFVVE